MSETDTCPDELALLRQEWARLGAEMAAHQADIERLEAELAAHPPAPEPDPAAPDSEGEDDRQAAFQAWEAEVAEKDGLIKRLSEAIARMCQRIEDLEAQAKGADNSPAGEAQ